MNKEIPIFFTVDDNYIPYLAVTLKSLIINHKTEEILNIKILHTKVKNENIKIIKEFQTEIVKIEFVDISDYVSKFKDKLYTRDYYSCSTYFRLFIPNLYQEFDKAIYLDSDCVILSDISNLYNIAIEDYLLIASPDDVIRADFREYALKVVGVRSYKEYFNAGVLVMNLRQLRQINFEEKFKYLLEHVKYTVAQDQDYLNRICKGRVKLISTTWNRMPIGQDLIPRDELNLIHYNLHLKPWHYQNLLYGEYFWKYAKEVPYYEQILLESKKYTLKDKENDTTVYNNLVKLAKFESDCVGDDYE